MMKNILPALLFCSPHVLAFHSTPSFRRTYQLQMQENIDGYKFTEFIYLFALYDD